MKFKFLRSFLSDEGPLLETLVLAFYVLASQHQLFKENSIVLLSSLFLVINGNPVLYIDVIFNKRASVFYHSRKGWFEAQSHCSMLLFTIFRLHEVLQKENYPLYSDYMKYLG